MQVLDATAAKTDEEKAKNDARFEKMQRMLAQKEARRKRVKEESAKEEEEEAPKKASETNKKSSKEKEAPVEENKVEETKEEPKAAPKASEDDNDNDNDNGGTDGPKKSMTQFEKMQARMANRKKEQKDGGGAKGGAAPKTAPKVQKKIDPLKNINPLVARNKRLREKRVGICDVAMSERQVTDREFEVGELVYFVSKDDNQYVSGTLSEFKTGGFWKIEKIVNPNNRNPALEEDEDPSRYVRTKPPTIKPEGYFKLMSPHDFEVEMSLEFAHMLRDYMKEFLKKRKICRPCQTKRKSDGKNR